MDDSSTALVNPTAECRLSTPHYCVYKGAHRAARFTKTRSIAMKEKMGLCTRFVRYKLLFIFLSVACCRKYLLGDIIVLHFCVVSGKIKTI